MSFSHKLPPNEYMPYRRALSYVAQFTTRLVDGLSKEALREGREVSKSDPKITGRVRDHVMERYDELIERAPSRPLNGPLFADDVPDKKKRVRKSRAKVKDVAPVEQQQEDVVVEPESVPDPEPEPVPVAIDEETLADLRAQAARIFTDVPLQNEWIDVKVKELQMPPFRIGDRDRLPYEPKVPSDDWILTADEEMAGAETASEPALVPADETPPTPPEPPMAADPVVEKAPLKQIPHNKWGWSHLTPEGWRLVFDEVPDAERMTVALFKATHPDGIIPDEPPKKKRIRDRRKSKALPA